MKTARTSLVLTISVLLIGAATLWLSYESAPNALVEAPPTQIDLSRRTADNHHRRADSEDSFVAESNQQPGIRAQFERADDLRSYVDDLAAKAAAGDPDAAWMISRVYDYCASYSVNPSSYARDSETMAVASASTELSLRMHRNRVATRCRGFSRKDGLNQALIVESRRFAAKAGSLPAEAALFAARDPLYAGPAYEKALVERIRYSRDPEAYLAISEAMGLSANDKRWDIEGLYGVPHADLAWQLAACQLGLDCGPRSSLMTMYCANAGICSSNADQDFHSFVFDAAVPRQGADRIQEMVRLILASRRSK